MTDAKTVLQRIAKEARPLIEQWLDLAEQFAVFREAATTHGLDWSAIKSLLKAQAQDERNDDGTKRVDRIIEKADFATAYADMLGLGSNMNENNFSSENDLDSPHDPDTGEIIETVADESPPIQSCTAEPSPVQEREAAVPNPAASQPILDPSDPGEIPEFMRRARAA